MKSVLITGANGFIGSMTAKTLIQNKYKTFGLVRKTSSLHFLKGIPIPLFFADVTNLKELLKQTKTLHHIDYIFHIAGLASDWGDYKKFETANIIGTLNILKLAKHLHAKKVIILSSLSVMGFNQKNATEHSHKTELKVNYVISKKIMETKALFFAKQNNVPITILRPGDVYGEHDRTTTLKLFHALEMGQLGFINSGKALLSPLYINNLITAMLLALKSTKSDYQIYNITDDVHITWKTYFGLISKCLKVKPPKLNIPYTLAYVLAYIIEGIYKLLHIKTPPALTIYRIKHAGLHYDFDITKAKKELHYKPNKKITMLIKKTTHWYKKEKRTKPSILITGISGLWGYNLASYFNQKANQFQVFGTYNTNKTNFPHISSYKIDLTNKTALKTLITKIKPDIIIHTAANSKVQDCQTHPTKAKKINVDTVKFLVELANLYKSKFIFFSTDLVYSGHHNFYTEKTKIRPINIYEQTKAMAEDHIIQNSYHYIILRTALSYGLRSPHHHSFIDWIINSVHNKTKVHLFTDQYRTPISIFDGVLAIDKMIQNDIKNQIINFGGIEKINRYDFGLLLAQFFKLDTQYIVPITYKKSKNIIFPSNNTAMDITKLKTMYTPKSIKHNLKLLAKKMRT